MKDVWASCSRQVRGTGQNLYQRYVKGDRSSVITKVYFLRWRLRTANIMTASVVPFGHSHDWMSESSSQTTTAVVWSSWCVARRAERVTTAIERDTDRETERKRETGVAWSRCAISLDSAVVNVVVTFDLLPLRHGIDGWAHCNTST